VFAPFLSDRWWRDLGIFGDRANERDNDAKRHDAIVLLIPPDVFSANGAASSVAWGNAPGMVHSPFH
jgi:hypothetical protein